MSGVISKLFGKTRAPTAVTQPAQPVTQQQAEVARDELLKRLARIRRATLTSELSNPNIRRRQLGAGV